jgi:hypothetical protein
VKGLEDRLGGHARAAPVPFVAAAALFTRRAATAQRRCGPGIVTLSAAGTWRSRGSRGTFRRSGRRRCAGRARPRPAAARHMQCAYNVCAAARARAVAPGGPCGGDLSLGDPRARARVRHRPAGRGSVPHVRRVRGGRRRQISSRGRIGQRQRARRRWQATGWTEGGEASAAATAAAAGGGAAAAACAGCSGRCPRGRERGRGELERRRGCIRRGRARGRGGGAAAARGRGVWAGVRRVARCERVTTACLARACTCLARACTCLARAAACLARACTCRRRAHTRRCAGGHGGPPELEAELNALSARLHALETSNAFGLDGAGHDE